MNYWTLQMLRRFRNGDRLKFGYKSEAFFELQGIPLKAEGVLRKAKIPYVEITENGSVFKIPFEYIECPEVVLP